jgi:hypothetical protein
LYSNQIKSKKRRKMRYTPSNLTRISFTIPRQKNFFFLTSKTTQFFILHSYQQFYWIIYSRTYFFKKRKKNKEKQKRKNQQHYDSKRRLYISPTVFHFCIFLSCGRSPYRRRIIFLICGAHLPVLRCPRPIFPNVELVHFHFLPPLLHHSHHHILLHDSAY